jgi:hypothetical protein
MSKKKAIQKGVPVTSRALEQRVNRALAKEDERLLKTRPGRPNARGEIRESRARQEFGEYYIVSTTSGGCSHKNIDLENWARDLKVLADWEYLEEEGN